MPLSAEIPAPVMTKTRISNMAANTAGCCKLAGKRQTGSRMKKRLFNCAVVVTLCLQSASLIAATDTTETRQREAQRYLEAVPPKAMFEDMADKMAVNFPSSEREKFKQTLTSQLNVVAVTRAMSDALVKHFTTDELKALADFYGSSVGRSAMQKFAGYMAELMPTIEREIRRAQQKVNRLQPAPSQSASPQ
jgi:hypothetical protein